MSLYKYFDKGEGELIVLIHGVENSGRFWDPISDKLAKKAHVVAVDLIGFGETPRPENGIYTLSDEIEALHNAIKDIKKPITVVGHSMGTFVAIAYASKYPENVKKIVLTSPVIIFQKPFIKYSKSPEILQHMYLSQIRVFRQMLLEVFTRLGNIYYSVAKSAVNFLPSILSVESLVEKQDVLAVLETIQDIPIEIMYGYFDPLVINSNIKLLPKIYQNIRAHRYLCSHDVPHRKESEFIRKVLGKLF